MILSRHLLSLLAVLALICFCAPSTAAQSPDLSGTYKGVFHDKGRNIKRSNFRIRITQNGEQIKAEATDNTLWITGLVVEDKVFVEWEHASGNRGDGVWDILENGTRLRGIWESKGSGRYYGDWDLFKQ